MANNNAQAFKDEWLEEHLGTSDGGEDGGRRRRKEKDVDGVERASDSNRRGISDNWWD